MFFLSRSSEEHVPMIDEPSNALMQPLVPLVPTRILPNTCKRSVGATAAPLPIPTLPESLIRNWGFPEISSVRNKPAVGVRVDGDGNVAVEQLRTFIERAHVL